MMIKFIGRLIVDNSAVALVLCRVTSEVHRQFE